MAQRQVLPTRFSGRRAKKLKAQHLGSGLFGPRALTAGELFCITVHPPPQRPVLWARLHSSESSCCQRLG